MAHFVKEGCTTRCLQEEIEDLGELETNGKFAACSSSRSDQGE